MSPPSPQPKQCHVSRAGVTMKLGVFSPWNGQSPLSVVPALFSCTVSPTTSTTVSLLLTSAATPTVNLPPRPCAVPVLRMPWRARIASRHRSPDTETACQALTRLDLSRLCVWISCLSRGCQYPWGVPEPEWRGAGLTDHPGEAQGSGRARRISAQPGALRQVACAPDRATIAATAPEGWHDRR